MEMNLAYQLDEFREELIGGRIVLMAPAATNHNRIAGNIFHIFRSYLNGRACEPFGDGEKVFLSETEHYVPDFMVVCDPDKVKWDGVHGAPDLVVEVLSPSTAKNDKAHKKDTYAHSGVKEYWIVSPGEKAVEQYLLQDGRFVLQAVHTLYPAYMLECMPEQERLEAEAPFQCSLFDDLDISLADVFYRTV